MDKVKLHDLSQDYHIYSVLGTQNPLHIPEKSFLRSDHSNEYTLPFHGFNRPNANYAEGNVILDPKIRSLVASGFMRIQETVMSNSEKIISGDSCSYYHDMLRIAVGKPQVGYEINRDEKELR